MDTMTGLEYCETYFLIPTENGTHFMSCVGKPAGNVSAETQGLVQGIWDQAYSNIKPFIEQDIASGKVAVTPTSHKATN